MKFAHITDAQLGYVQYGLKERSADFNSAFHFAIEESINRHVDAVVFGGDLFDAGKPSGEYVEMVQSAVRRLRAAGIDVLGVEGNHDWSNGKWLEVCNIHDLERHYPFVCNGVRFFGLGYQRESQFMHVLGLHMAGQKAADVLVLHQGVAETMPLSTVRASEIVHLLKPIGLRHMAMGHIHGMYAINVDGVTVVCPGSLEMTDIDERREKYFAITEIPEDKALPATTELVKVPVRPILHHIVETEQDLEKARLDIASSHGSLFVGMVSTGLVDGYARLAKAATDAGIPYRLVGFNPAQLYTAKPVERDRTAGVLDLTKYVSRAFPEGSDAHGLVTAMLSAPASAADTMKNYITTKLKELGYA